MISTRSANRSRSRRTLASVSANRAGPERPPVFCERRGSSTRRVLPQFTMVMPASSAAGMVVSSLVRRKSGDTFTMMGLSVALRTARNISASSDGRSDQPYTSFVLGDEMLISTRSPKGASPSTTDT